MIQRARADHSAEHTKLVHDILKDLGAGPNGRVWQSKTGAGYPPDQSNRLVFFGLKGSSDIFGIMKPRGRFLALEAKTGKGAPTTDQRAFLAMVNAMGGIGRVVRSIEEARAAFAEACAP